MKLPTPTNYGTSLGCGKCSSSTFGFKGDGYPSLDTGKCYLAHTTTGTNAAGGKTACAGFISGSALAAIQSPLENAGENL